MKKSFENMLNCKEGTYLYSSSESVSASELEREKWITVSVQEVRVNLVYTFMKRWTFDIYCTVSFYESSLLFVV